MSRLAHNLAAEVEAAKFAVPPQIHADDFIYQYLLDTALTREPDRDKTRANVTEYYFADGDQSARRLDDLVRQHHPGAASRRLSIFEFASGYGCVSRHLRKMDDHYDLVACDIHPKAIKFLREQIGVNAVLSCTEPRDFDAKGKFDVVFALSFFSHMPDRTFGAWITALFETLADDGLLIFTTHGRVKHEVSDRPVLEPEGYCFFSNSEQKDIPSDEYGVTFATPFYVMDQIARCSCAAVVLFQEAFWWGQQDVFIVQKVQTDFRPRRAEVQLSIAAAQNRIRAMERSAQELREVATRSRAEAAAQSAPAWRAAAERDTVIETMRGEAAERDTVIEKMQGEITSLNEALAHTRQIGPTIVQLFSNLRLVFQKKPIMLADRAREAGQWAVAAHYYRRALDRNPNRPDIWIQYGHVLKEADRLSPAEQAYRQAIAGAPTLAEPYRYLGDVLSAQGKQHEAATAYLKAQSLDPTSPHALSGLRKLGWSEKDSVAVEGISD